MLKKIFELLKKILPLFFKIAGTGYLIYYLGFKVSWKEFGALLPQISYVFLAAAGAMHLLKLIFETLKWFLLNKAYEIQLPFFKLYRYKFIGPAFDLLTPVPQGEDVFKFYLLEKTSGNIGKAVIIPLFSKAMGLAGIAFMMPFTLWAFIAQVNLPYLQQLLLKLGMVSLVAVAMVVLLRSFLFRYLWQFRFFAENYPRLLQLLAIIKNNPLVVLQVFICGLFAHVSYIAFIFFIVKAFGISIPFLWFLTGLPLIYVSALVPITAGGIGQKEAIVLWLLLQQGVLLSTAQGVALMHLILLLMFVVAGFILYFFEE